MSLLWPVQQKVPESFVSFSISSLLQVVWLTFVLSFSVRGLVGIFKVIFDFWKLLGKHMKGIARLHFNLSVVKWCWLLAPPAAFDLLLILFVLLLWPTLVVMFVVFQVLQYSNFPVCYLSFFFSQLSPGCGWKNPQKQTKSNSLRVCKMKLCIKVTNEEECGSFGEFPLCYMYLPISQISQPLCCHLVATEQTANV